MYIGAILIRHRNAKRWSQNDLFVHSGVSQSTISRIESDKQEADEEQISALSKALGIAPEALQQPDSPVFRVDNQHGGYSNNYFTNRAVPEGELSILKAYLKSVEEKFEQSQQYWHEVVNAKDEQIRSLIQHIQVLSERIGERK
jgi:transcriptional regulator with XRE-family HTH domain